MPLASELTLFIYTAFNAGRVFSYIPQIFCISRDTEGAKAISLATWWLWIGANGSTALYAIVNVGDLPLAMLNGLNTLACLVVVALTTWKRRQHRLESSRAVWSGVSHTGLPSPVGSV